MVSKECWKLRNKEETMILITSHCESCDNYCCVPYAIYAIYRCKGRNCWKCTKKRIVSEYEIVSGSCIGLGTEMGVWLVINQALVSVHVTWLYLHSALFIPNHLPKFHSIWVPDMPGCLFSCMSNLEGNLLVLSVLPQVWLLKGNIKI